MRTEITDSTPPSFRESLRSLRGFPKSLADLYVAYPITVVSHLLLATGIATILFIGGGSFFASPTFFTPSRALVSSYLTSLATVQASVVAIAVSVLILGIQLIANRFSTRLTTVVLENPVFATTFALLIGSIGLDLWLAFNIKGFYTPVSLPLWSNAIQFFQLILLYLSGILALLAGTLLYFTIIHGVRRSTPQGVLQILGNNLSPKLLIEQSFIADEDETKLHPLTDVHFIIIDAIKNREPRVSNKGMNIYESTVLNVRELIMGMSRGRKNNTTRFDGPIFGPMFNEQIPNIITVSEKNDKRDVARNAVKLLEKTSGINKKEPIEEFQIPCLNSYLITVERLQWDSSAGYSLFKCISNIGTQLESSVRKGWFQTTQEMSNTCYRRFPSLANDSEDKIAEPILSHFLRKVTNSITNLFSQHKGDTLEINGVSENLNQKEKCLKSLTILYFRIIALVIDAAGEGGVRSTTLRSSWEQISQISPNSVCREYLLVLNQALIETVLLRQNTEEEFERKLWINLILRTMDSQGPQLMLDAFANVQARKFDSTETQWGLRSFWGEVNRGEFSQGIIPTEIHPEPTYENKDEIKALKEHILIQYRTRVWNESFVRQYIRRFPSSIEEGFTIKQLEVDFEPVDYIGRDSRGRATHIVICKRFDEDVLSELDLTGIQRTIIVSPQEPDESPKVEEALSFDDLKVRTMDFMTRPSPNQTQLREFFSSDSTPSSKEIDKDQWEPPEQMSQATLHYYG